MKKIIMISWIALCLISGGSAFAAKGGKSTTEQGALPNGKPFQQIQKQFASVDDQINALVGAVEDLEERVTANENAIADLQTQNADLEQQAADLAATVGDNQDDIDALQDQYENNLSVIESLQDQIDDINTNLALKQDILNGSCPSGSALQSINPDGSITCTSTSSGVQHFSVYSSVYVPGSYSYSTNHSHPYSCGIFSTSTCYYNHVHTNYSNGEAEGTATCPDNSVLVGGGYSNAYYMQILSSQEFVP